MITVDDAVRVLRADYWRSIRGIARGVLDALERDGTLDESDMIREAADGSYWVIYTHANYRAIMCSDADPFALAEDYGLALLPDNLQILPTLAFLVVEHDVREQIEALRT